MCLLSLKALHLFTMHLISFPAACCPAGLNTPLFGTEQSILQRPSLTTTKYHFFLSVQGTKKQFLLKQQNKWESKHQTKTLFFNLLPIWTSPPELFTRDLKLGGNKNGRIDFKRKCKYKVSVLWQNSPTTSLAISSFHLTVGSDLVSGLGWNKDLVRDRWSPSLVSFLQ